MSEVTNYTTYTLEDVVNAISRASYQIGIVVGLDEAANELLKRAGEQFAKGHDAIARHTRDLSHALKAQSEQRRKDYGAYYQPEKEAAWKEIDRREKLHEPGR